MREATDLLTQVRLNERLNERRRCALIVRQTAAYWRELGEHMGPGGINVAIAEAIDAVALDIEDSR
jgi:hypothetical protein